MDRFWIGDGISLSGHRKKLASCRGRRRPGRPAEGMERGPAISLGPQLKGDVEQHYSRAGGHASSDYHLWI